MMAKTCPKCFKNTMADDSSFKSAQGAHRAALKTSDYFVQRAANGGLTGALALLDRTGGQLPVHGDEYQQPNPVEPQVEI